MSAPVAPTPKRRWWTMRRYWLSAAIFGGIALTPFVIPLYQGWQLDRDLEAVSAETDRLDPGWRFEEMQARKRPPVPDAENADPILASIGKLLPKAGVFEATCAGLMRPEGMEAGDSAHTSWISDIQSSIGDVPEAIQLNAQQIEALEYEWKQHRQAFELASTLRAYRRCGFAFDPPAKPHERRAICRHTACLLRMKLLLDFQGERLHDALDQLEALLSVIEFLHDDTEFNSPFIQAAILSITHEGTKRILAQGEANAKRLPSIQAAMQKYDNPRPLPPMRRLRADSWKDSLGILTMPRSKQVETIKLMSGLRNFMRVKNDEQLEEPWYLAWLRKDSVEDPRRWALTDQRLANQWIEFVKQTEDSQRNGIDALRAKSHNTTFSTIHKMNWRVTMEVRTTRTAIALERYRQATGAWPKSLDQLVPAYLDHVPQDIFTGAPLQYRVLDRGAIVYSVGQDKIDNGGKLRPDADTPGPVGLDIGVRLWDPEHRRQPPLPPVMPRPMQDGF